MLLFLSNNIPFGNCVAALHPILVHGNMLVVGFHFRYKGSAGFSTLPNLFSKRVNL
jgi:hypothetical protein